MLRTLTSLFVLSALALRANAFSSIVAFGDSLTDDCTLGISSVIDDAVDTNQVRGFLFLEFDRNRQLTKQL